ncbi:unnamed protein product, partial [Clonostachys chloroleuca]
MVSQYLSGLAVFLPSPLEPWHRLQRHILTKRYATADLRTVYSLNPNNPVIPDTALSKVLFRCTDTVGTIAGNSYCIVGCGVVGDNLVDDQ